MNTTSHDTTSPAIETGEDYPEIREGVRKVCSGFPGAYWRALEETLSYPTEFVRALTEAGYLGALIPEVYGGSGMPRCTRWGLYFAMAARSRSGATCRKSRAAGCDFRPSA